MKLASTFWILVAVLLVCAIVPDQVSASVASYDSPSRTVIISRGLDVGIGKLRLPPIFGGGDIASYTLTGNTDQCLTDCEATGTAVLYSDESLFDDVNFKTSGGHGISIKNYTFYVSDSGEDYESPIYDYVCHPYQITGDNGTASFNNCTTIQNGTEILQRPVWQIYNEGDILPAGDYSWKIEGIKDATQSVDWVANAQGEDFNEWAWWIGVTPTAYYKMNESSGNAADSSGNGYTLTNTGTVPFNTGKLGNAGNFSGNGNTHYFTTSTASPWEFGTGNFTIAFWIKQPSNADSRVIIVSDSDWLNAHRFGIFKSAAHKLSCSIGASSIVSSTSIDDNNWHRLIAVRKGTGINLFKIYLDGNSVPDATGTAADDLNTASGLWIGGGNAGIQTGINGLLDDIQIFNGYAWTSADVVSDWNSGSGKEADTIYPVLTITNSIPANNANISTSSVTFGCNATSIISNITSVILNVTNGSSSWTQTISGLNTDSYNATFVNSSFGAIADGIYSWNCIGYGDTANGTSAIWNFTKTNPVLALCNATYTTPYVNFTFKDEQSLSNINASINSMSMIYWINNDNFTTKTLTFSNLSVNPSYAFCAYPNVSLSTNISMQYSSSQGSTFPQRIYASNNLALTNVTENVTLYLLSSGQYVTFQVINPNYRSPISGVAVTATTSINGVPTQVNSQITDTSGGALMYLSPTTSYTIQASKTGYQTSTFTVSPSQTQYTITLLPFGGTGSNNTNSGTVYSLFPADTELSNLANYTFGLTLIPSTNPVTSFGFNVTNSSGSVLYSAVSSANGGTLSASLNTSTDSQYILRAFWISGNVTMTVLKYYPIINNANADYGLFYFGNDAAKFANAGIFGITYFGIDLLIFCFIFITVGIMSWKFGLYSPSAVSVMIFAEVMLFDAVLGLIHTFMAQGVLTMIAAIAMVALMVREMTTY